LDIAIGRLTVPVVVLQALFPLSDDDPAAHRWQTRSTARDEFRNHFRFRQHLNETVSLAEQRQLFEVRWSEVRALLQAV
jgi:hypothetical protein